MKHFFSKFLATVLIIFAFASFPVVSQAYHCQWRDGHRVCWHTQQNRCYWVNSYWRHGYYHPAHKVCRW